MEPEKKMASVSGTLVTPEGRTLAWQLRRIPAKGNFPDGVSFEVVSMGRTPERCVSLYARHVEDIRGLLLAFEAVVGH